MGDMRGADRIGANDFDMRSLVDDENRFAVFRLVRQPLFQGEHTRNVFQIHVKYRVALGFAFFNSVELEYLNLKGVRQKLTQVLRARPRIRIYFELIHGFSEFNARVQVGCRDAVQP